MKSERRLIGVLGWAAAIGCAMGVLWCAEVAEGFGKDHGKVYVMRPNVTSDFFDLFEDDAAWQRVMSRLDVFRFHLNRVNESDWYTNGAKMMGFLNRHEMESCVITGGLRAFSGCDGEEQGRRDLLKLHKVSEVGGVVDQMIMDAAFRNLIVGFPNPQGLDLTIEEAAGEIVEYMKKIHSEYPGIKIGMNEPVPWYWWESYPEHMGRPAPDLKECIDALLAACAAEGETLWFVHADCPYEYANDPPAGFDGWAKLVAMQEYVQGLGIPFGLMHNSRDGGNDSDKLYFERTMLGLQKLLAAGGDPWEFALQSWYTHPLAVLPEDPDPLPQNEGDIYPFTYLTKEFMIASGALFPADYRGFKVTRGDGEILAWVSEAGDLTLEGSLIENTTARGTGGSDLLVKDEEGTVVAVVTSSGDMALLGTAYEGQSTLSPPAGSLVFKNGAGEAVGYISAVGDLYLRGSVTSAP